MFGRPPNRRLLPAVLLALTGCSAGNGSDPPAGDGTLLLATQPEEVLVYVCPGYGEVRARIGSEAAALWLDGEWRVLPRTRSASGARFAAADRLLWDRGPEALISLGSGEPEGCRRREPGSPWAEAGARGIDFRKKLCQAEVFVADLLGSFRQQFFEQVFAGDVACAVTGLA